MYAVPAVQVVCSFDTLLMLALGVEGVPNSVAEEVPRQNGNEDEESGNQNEWEVVDDPNVPSYGEHEAPTGLGFSNAQAEKAKRRLAKDVAWDGKRGLDNRVAERTWQDMFSDYLEVAQPHGSRTQDKIFVLYCKYLTAYDPGDARPAQKTEDKDDKSVDLVRIEIRRKYSPESKQQVDRWNRDNYFREPHEEIVPEAAKVAGQTPD